MSMGIFYSYLMFLRILFQFEERFVNDGGKSGIRYDCGLYRSLPWRSRFRTGGCPGL